VALEVARDNIRVNSIHPGNVRTSMVAGLDAAEVGAGAVRDLAIPRIAEPEEITQLVLFVASDAASFSTGSEFIADGGQLLGPVPQQERAEAAGGLNCTRAYTIRDMPREEAIFVRSLCLKEMKMKDSKALMLEYLASIRDPERAAALFADDGVFELPFLRSLGVKPRYAGRREIVALLHQLLNLYPNFAFARDEVSILIETRKRRSLSTWHTRAPLRRGRTVHHLFAGYLVAKDGEISLLRESFNPWRWRRRNCRMGSPTSQPPAMRCTLSESSPREGPEPRSACS